MKMNNINNLQKILNRVNEEKLQCILPEVILYITILLYNFLGITFEKDMLELKLKLLTKNIIIRLSSLLVNYTQLFEYIAMVAIDKGNEKT